MINPNTSVAAQNLVNIHAINPNIVLDIRYATTKNFLAFKAYPKAVCYLHKDVALALNRVQLELEKCSLSLKIFDGYRPLSVQQLMWDKIQDDRFVSNPAHNKGRHTRGTAVDVTLIDTQGNNLQMTSDFDEFSERAHSQFMDAPLKAIENRNLLNSFMQSQNLIQLPTEWWHFDLQGWQDDIRYPSLDITFDELEEADKKP